MEYTCFKCIFCYSVSLVLTFTYCKQNLLLQSMTLRWTRNFIKYSLHHKMFQMKGADLNDTCILCCITFSLFGPWIVLNTIRQDKKWNLLANFSCDIYKSDQIVIPHNSYPLYQGFTNFSRHGPHSPFLIKSLAVKLCDSNLLNTTVIH